MHTWEEDKSKIVALYHECIHNVSQTLFSIISKDLKKYSGVREIAIFIHGRIEAVWLLAMEERPWDADIIDRTVLETLIKLAFIVYAPDKTERELRLNQFWNDLWEINTLRQSEQSKKNLKHAKDDISTLAHSPLILKKEDEEKLKRKWNKKDRNILAQKWSFSEMLASLSKSYKGESFEGLLSLAHEYKMCSHVSHGDETGISIILERDGREADEKAAVNRAHIIKLYSNCLAYISWTAMCIAEYGSEDPRFLGESIARIAKIKDIERKYQNQVFNDVSYDKYRK